MTDLLIISALVIEVLALSAWDKRTFGTWITPFTVLAVPYTAVVLLASAAAPALDLVTLYTPSVLIWMAVLAVFWFFGGFFGFAICSCSRNISRRLSLEDEDVAQRWAVRIGCGLILCSFLQLYSAQLAVGGWSQVASIEFKAAFTRGLLSHALVLAIPILTILIGTINRRSGWLNWSVLVLLFGFFVIGGVKGTALQPLASGLFYRILTGKMRITPRAVLTVILISFLLFNSIYLIATSIASPESLAEPEVYLFFSRHYVFYLCAGVLAFSEATRTNVSDVGGDTSMIFAPLENIYSALAGSGDTKTIGSSHEKGMSIDQTTEKVDAASNVYTWIGTLYLYLGPLGCLLYMAIVSLVSYSLLLSLRTSSSAWFLIVYLFVCGQLLFGFFEFYFWHLNALEVPAYCLVLAALSKVRTRQLRRFNQNEDLAPC